MKDYDIIVIGAGSGGLANALMFNELNLKVLIVDIHVSNFGGECVHSGCIPSKALLEAAKNFNSAKKLKLFSDQKSTVQPNWNKIQSHIKKIQQELYEEESPTSLEEHGIDVKIGKATFSSNNSISINGINYSAKKIIIATGSSPRTVDIPGLNDSLITVLTNENMFEVDTLPESIVILGGGPIGCEMGQAYNRLGVKVYIVERGEEILSRDDKQAAKILRDSLEQEGVTFLLSSEVTKVENNTITITKDNKEELTLENISAILFAIGRTVNTTSLGLENTDVKLDDNKNIILNDYLEASIPSILVAGDVAREAQLSHAAEQHARLHIRNFLFPLIKQKLPRSQMSWVTLTEPELLSFGPSESELRKAKTKFEIIEYNFKDNDRSRVDNTVKNSYAKILIKKGLFKSKILGGTVLAPHAGELGQELLMMQQFSLPAHYLRDKLYPYPTRSRSNQIMYVNYQRKNFSESLKKIAKGIFRLLN